MDFNFDGLPEPIRLPDEYLTVRQYENFQRFAVSRGEVPEDGLYMREAIAAILEDPDFVKRTESLPMPRASQLEWSRLYAHLGMLATGKGKTVPLAKASGTKRKRSVSEKKKSASS